MATIGTKNEKASTIANTIKIRTANIRSWVLCFIFTSTYRINEHYQKEAPVSTKRKTLTEKGCYDIFCWFKASGNNEKNKILNYERNEVMVNLLFAYGQMGGTTGQGTGSGSPMSLIFMIIAIFAVMYFLMIRPQQRQKKQHQELLSKVSKGDKIVTSGGMYGTIVGVKDSTVIVKIADNVKVEVNRSSISQIVSSRSSKSQTTRQEESDQKEDKAKK